MYESQRNRKSFNPSGRGDNVAWNAKIFAGFLLEGNEDAAWEAAMNAIHSYNNRTQLFEELITKAMQHIGDLWESDQITVADEHLATSTCEYILARFQHELKHTQTIKQLREKKAMFMCLENEQHDIGLKMVSQVFEEYGWKTRLLGANLPLDDALKAAEKWQPSIIGLSFSIWYHAELLSTYIHALEKLSHKPIVMVGGRLLSNYDFTSYCSENTKLFPTLTELHSWLMNHSSQGV
ncbi:cobalamin B12-binding domain-containing protein [Metabacillus sp. HB246100]|uniref:cobalamin B12-binding domain-containing protein n=1 Tax=Bacillus weihaiensis TaxID=1547283 RepID=UPI00235259F2|nr:cobalamin-dependent protein [Bacillus weihaiensis]